jgi:hypothetical protein
MPAVASPALVRTYADRFDAAWSDGTHSVGSPLGAWLLLALVAPAARGGDREELEALLGADADDAHELANDMLNTPHPAVAAALVLWHRDEYLRPDFAEWMRTLPAAAETGRVPAQVDADAWARRTTNGIIERFPLEIGADVVLVLANALATRVEWTTSFALAPARALGGPWSQQVDRVLEAPSGGHQMVITRTDRAGDVAVHAAASDDGLLVVSVIADPSVAPVDVRAAAHDVAAVLVRSSTPMPIATAYSLFDLPTGDGHAWTVVERQVGAADDPPREVYRAFLPVWAANGDHDLTTRPALGFPAARRVLEAFVDPTGPLGFEAKQVVSAAFHRRGFEAAAITSMAVLLSAPAPSATVTQRMVTLRFGRPYAVVAVALDPAGGPWHGVPVFSAWVAEPSEPFDETTPGE